LTKIWRNLLLTTKSPFTVAESIRVTFDPNLVEYSDLLQMFASFHTPENPRWTGTQYRSAIFYHNEQQRKLAEDFVRGIGALGKYVAVEPASDFYQGEEYHQKYLDKMSSL
jgi:peptide-methionine (S)-S-oxide reductase